MDVGLAALALQDFLPVVLSGLGFATLARRTAALDASAGRLVWASTWLLVVGGLSKPVYKSMLALSSSTVDVRVLDDVLFWLLAPGFLLAAAGLRTARRIDAGGLRSRSQRWAPVAATTTVGIATTLAVVGDGEAWFLLLLAVATIANVAVVVVLVRWSRAREDDAAALLFLANITIVFGLAWSAAALPQTIPVQWAEQSASTVAQATFLYGAVRLGRAGSSAPATA